MVPLATVLVVLVALAVSTQVGPPSGDQSFAFRVSWPTPSQYLPGNPTPNVYLQINYTGTGVKNYTYVISAGPAVIGQGAVGVTARSPSTVYAIAPVPGDLEAQVFEHGTLVFVQNLTLS